MKAMLKCPAKLFKNTAFLLSPRDNFQNYKTTFRATKVELLDNFQNYKIYFRTIRKDLGPQLSIGKAKSALGT